MAAAQLVLPNSRNLCLPFLKIKTVCNTIKIGFFSVFCGISWCLLDGNQISTELLAFLTSSNIMFGILQQEDQRESELRSSSSIVHGVTTTTPKPNV
jgi:hypothetical protein